VVATSMLARTRPWFRRRRLYSLLSISYALTKEDGPLSRGAALSHPDQKAGRIIRQRRNAGGLSFDCIISRPGARHMRRTDKGGARLVQTDHGQLDLFFCTYPQCKMRACYVLTFLLVAPAFADAPVTVHLKNHRFTPHIRVKQ